MILAQSAPAAPIERIHGIRDRFSEGGSAEGFIIVILAIGALFVALYIVASVIRRMRRRQTNSPRMLFQEVLRQLPLTIPQRELLRRIARDLALEHPAIILLSPQIFREHANRWMAASRNANNATRDRLLTLSGALFDSKS